MLKVEPNPITGKRIAYKTNKQQIASWPQKEKQQGTNIPVKTRLSRV